MVLLPVFTSQRASRQPPQVEAPDPPCGPRFTLICRRETVIAALTSCPCRSQKSPGGKLDQASLTHLPTRLGCGNPHHMDSSHPKLPHSGDLDMPM